jgi:tetratricopeptide (TPR) repeat protein
LIQEAMKLYEEAIEIDKKFTVAYNNLGFLHLERAKRSLKHGTSEDGAGEKRAELDLKLALEKCEQGVESDVTYHHTYDNLGNIWLKKSELNSDQGDSAMRKAEDFYHKAVAYMPT